jgi:hypothetical protein
MKKTLIAAAAFGVLIAVALLVMKSPEKGERVGESPRPVPAIAAGDVDTLVVTKDGKATTIKREGDAFKIVDPVAYPADKDSGKDAFEAIEKLEFGSLVTNQKSRHKDFEVDDSAVRVAAKKGDKVVADLRVGKVSNNMTLVRVEGKDEVWQAQGSLKYKFDRDTSGWRDKSITTFEEANVTGLEVKASDGSRIVLARVTPDADAGVAEAGWTVKETTLKIDDLDKSIADGIVNSMYAFKANDFGDGAKPEETGLANPKLTVVVTLKDGKSETVHLGNKKGEDEFYLKKEGSEQIFTARKWNVERLAKRPIEFRDKTLCNLSEGEIGQVAVAGNKDAYTLVRTGKEGADAWKLSKPTGIDLDTGKVTSIAGAFVEWKAKGFAEASDPKATGLGRPTATIDARSKLAGGAGCTLKIGAETEDKQSYFAQLAGKPDVFEVPKWAVDRVLVKHDDLKKK